jgi:NADPH2:quinone reductase
LPSDSVEDQAMKQIGVTGPGGPSVLQVENASRPVPRAGEVLIEVRAAGVNRPDISQREGRYPPPPGASPVLGLEVAGYVSALGAEVSTLAVGDAVCALAPGGGYAEFCAVPAGHCLPVPEGFSMIEAAGLPETFFTVWANVFQLGQLRAGERLLVHGGTSGIGTTAIQLARAFGAEVYVTAGSEEKCEAARKLGATAALDYKQIIFEEEILRRTEGRGMDVVLDMVGGPYTERNLKCLARDGRIVQIATQLGATVNLNLIAVMQKRARITGSMLRPRSVEEKARIADELRAQVWPRLARGEMRPVIDRVFALEAVAEAHAYLESGQHVGKVILRVGDAGTG